ncbi:MAG: HAD family hydrolase [Candidatus Woykebacteria bacterium]
MSKPEIISHAFFDWSGVLSNDPIVICEANNRMFEEQGLPRLTLEQWRPRTRLTAAEIMRDHGIAGTDQEHQEWYHRVLDGVKADGIVPQAYPNAKQLLHLLKSKGFTIGVLSTHPLAHLREEADQYGLSSLVSVFMGDSRSKADGIRKLLSQFGVTNPRHALYVGDTVYDIQQAKEVGVVSVAVCEGFHDKDRLDTEDPDFLFDNLNEVLKAVEEDRIAFLN